MYKSMTLLVLVALAAFVFAAEPQQQDQETAEQYYRIHGVYPSWYNQYGALAGVRYAGYPYTYGAYPTYAGGKMFYGAYPAGYAAPANTYHAYSGFGYAY